MLSNSTSYSQQDTSNYHAAQRETDPYVAIIYYTNAIKYCAPNSGELRSSYINRGLKKFEVKDYYGSIADLEKGLAIDVKTSKIYFMVDFVVLEFEEQQTCYYILGLCYYGIDDKKSGCLYLSKAGEIGVKEAYDAIKQLCNKN